MIRLYSREQQFPLIDKSLCEDKQNLMRSEIKLLIEDLSKKNKKIPSNILHALGNIKPSQLLDHKLWDFKNLEKTLEMI